MQVKKEIPSETVYRQFLQLLDLYDKVAGFGDTFSSLGDLIARLSGAFEKARLQLYDGKGNVMRRIEGLKSLGVTPKKSIKDLDDHALTSSGDDTQA